MASSSARWTLEPEAYALPLLHAARHPSASLNGLFLGSAAAKSITHAVPLHHLPQSLQYSFAQDLSLELVANHVQALARGLEIVGYYHANERFDDEALGQRGERVLLALKRNAGEAANDMFALVIANSKLATSEPAYIPYLSPTSASPPTASWFEDHFTLPSPDIPQQALQLIRQDSVHQHLHDCDDYLEDASIDFLQNDTVAEALKAKFRR